MRNSKKEYFDVLNSLLDTMPEVKGVFILDCNANIIAHAIKEYHIDKIDSISINAVVVHLSGQKLTDLFKSGDLEHFLIKSHDGWLVLFHIDNDRILLAHLDRDVKLGLIFLEMQRDLIEKIRKLPYSIPSETISLDDRLKELEDEFSRNIAKINSTLRLLPSAKTRLILDRNANIIPCVKCSSSHPHPYCSYAQFEPSQPYITKSSHHTLS